MKFYAHTDFEKVALGTLNASIVQWWW